MINELPHLADQTSSSNTIEYVSTITFEMYVNTNYLHLCDRVDLPRHAIHAGGVGRDACEQKLQLLVHPLDLRREEVDFFLLTLDYFERPRLSTKRNMEAC